MPWPPQLAQRVLQPELMDDPALDPARHRRALAALAHLNLVSRTSRTLWRAIRPIAAAPGHPSPTLLDIATGSGDVPIRIAQLARRDGVTLRISGVDSSPVAIEAARRRARLQGVDASFACQDVLGGPLGGPHDIVMCSLFMHHLARPQAVATLYKMKCAASRLVLVSDLLRAQSSYLQAWAASRFTLSRIARVDALLSVRAAWTIEEFAAIASEAGLAGAAIRPCWPARFLLEWRRS
jgi:2-polyprenyl-3-methyl-5-hydroxy-6-metoxy-1,4-benzoquinol methylase